MNEQRARTWLRRPLPSGAEPRKARSVYRTRLGLAGFGLLLATAAATYLGVRAAGDAPAGYLAAAVFFGMIAVVAAVNVVVVGLRWRATRRDGHDGDENAGIGEYGQW
ncbi:DUF6343 family protein [Phytoactinopolyspora mesophila]|uniref:Uncharacterized protein n=1 Tax=Phytoactinopolyspora mesophila TaxID=2650750 RepID=A0A7K3LY39_9ACTN|nr:DUF6343 family protein [Phytoactinopolyspora mesophila]NDL55900.1 hypothetical protein [Phytoactinopolyspora mesophila]